MITAGTANPSTAAGTSRQVDLVKLVAGYSNTLLG